jgi:rare lipoprotein A
MLVWWLVLVLLLAGCAGKSPKDGPPRSGSVIPRDLPEDPVPRKEPKSRYGNGPFYEALGKRYEVMGSSYGYQERGVASWYGNKFHGRQTSSHERYDMYAMTAAHKSLPLPTYVRVRNLRNHKSVIVRVNDRGPFVANRIIDLSYSAALRLDMIRQTRRRPRHLSHGRRPKLNPTKRKRSCQRKLKSISMFKSAHSAMRRTHGADLPS